MDAVAAAEKQYVNVAEKRNINYPHIEKALVIVRKFIQDRKRILYGGMAIDLNLKSAGEVGIYSEDTIPDYDIMSPDFFQDSLDLADILYKAGLPGISAINQLHVTGRRVRVNFVTVCDIGYIPQDVYDRIPRREITNLPKYKGLWVVSPDFQRLDVHRAFCHPYENAPQETIMHRFAKDQKRFRLLDAQFPLVPGVTNLASGAANLASGAANLASKVTGASKGKDIPTDKNDKFHTSISITWRELEGQAITGFLAYALLRRYLEHLLAKPQLPSISAEKLREAEKMLGKIPRHDVKITDTGIELEWNLPMRARLSVLSNDYEEFIQKNATGRTLRYYTRFLDGLRPRAVRFFWSPKAELKSNEDSYESTSLIPRLIQKFQDLEALFPLKGSRKLAELVKEAKIEHESFTTEPGLPSEALITWCDRLRSMWEAILPDIEIGNPTAQAAKRMLEELPTAKQTAAQEVPATVPELEVLDCMGALIPVFQLRGAFQALGQMCQMPKEISSKVKNWPERVYIAQAQYHLMHFLQGAYESPKLAHIFREYYINMTNMILIMEMLGQELFTTTLPKVSADSKAWSLYRTIPFYLGTETLGTLTRNYNLSYLAGVRERILQVQASLPNVLLSGEGGESKSLRPPFGYYPEREGPHQVFSTEGNPLFMTNGARCTKEVFDSLTMRILIPEVLRDPEASPVVEKTDSDDD